MQKSSGLPGFATAIVNKDTVLYQQGFGFADIAHKQPYTTGTLLAVLQIEINRNTLVQQEGYQEITMSD